MHRTIHVTRRAVLAGLAICSAAAAAVVTTQSAVRTFLGGASGKLVYTKLDCDNNDCNKHGHSLWYVDFSEATLTERRIIRLDTALWSNDQGEPRNTIISSDGQWVVFNVLDQDNKRAGSQLYACRLQQNVTTRVSYGTGALPRLWQRPGTAEWYVIYNSKDLEESGGWAMSFPCYTATTSMRQVDPSTMQPLAAGQELLGVLANGNRSKSGAWLFAAGGVPGTFRIDPSAVSGATALETIGLSVEDWNMTDSLDGCNPSMSPHESEADLRVMYVCNDGDNNHRAYWLCTVRGENRVRIPWDCAENPYIDEPEWCTTHPQYAAAKASIQLTTAPYDIYLYRPYDAQYLKVLEGNYSFPFLWVDPNTIGVRQPLPHECPAGTRASGGVRLADIRGRVIQAEGARPAPGAYVVAVRGTDGRAAGRRVVVR